MRRLQYELRIQGQPGVYRRYGSDSSRMTVHHWPQHSLLSEVYLRLARILFEGFIIRERIWIVSHPDILKNE